MTTPLPRDSASLETPLPDVFIPRWTTVTWDNLGAEGVVRDVHRVRWRRFYGRASASSEPILSRSSHGAESLATLVRKDEVEIPQPVLRDHAVSLWPDR